MISVLVVGATGSIGRLVVEEGDTRQAGDPSDGAVARRQIAQVLVGSLGSDHALRKTFELVATTGPEPDDLDVLVAPLDADPRGALDGVHDAANMPPAEEPQRVREDLEAVVAHARSPRPRRAPDLRPREEST